MLKSLLRLSVAFSAFSLIACGGGDDDSGGTGGGGGMGGSGGSAGTPGMCSNMVSATPEQNYQFSSKLTVKLTPVKPSSDITFDWSQLSVDFLKKPVDLNTIDMVSIIQWKLGIADFEKGLNDDTLAMEDVEIPSWIPTTATHATSGSVFQVEVPDGPLDMATVLDHLDIAKYPPEDFMYTAMPANGTMLGQGTRMIHAFVLDSTSTNTKVDITSDSTKLDFMATIMSRPPTYIPAATGDVTLDWGKMKLTAAGGTFLPQQITRIRVGSYDPSLNLEGDNFLKLDEIATEMYEAEVTVGTKFNFSQTKTKGEKAFAGIDDTHTWIVALNCGNCQNPAPWYLSVLKSCPASP